MSWYLELHPTCGGQTSGPQVRRGCHLHKVTRLGKRKLWEIKVGQQKQSFLLPGGWKGANGNGRVNKQENPHFTTFGAETSHTKSWFSCFVARPKLSAGDSSA